MTVVLTVPWSAAYLAASSESSKVRTTGESWAGYVVAQRVAERVPRKAVQLVA